MTSVFQSLSISYYGSNLVQICTSRFLRNLRSRKIQARLMIRGRYRSVQRGHSWTQIFLQGGSESGQSQPGSTKGDFTTLLEDSIKHKYMLLRQPEVSVYFINCISRKICLYFRLTQYATVRLPVYTTPPGRHPPDRCIPSFSAARHAAEQLSLIAGAALKRTDHFRECFYKRQDLSSFLALMLLL